ncbi:MAG: SDR family NAD(P)-dependent oxidoreductase, partial [Planctomycetota bacterium]|nr:SDR family NAD(P)-dependent oxidoreductase [Planctomycetota bacterium]
LFAREGAKVFAVDINQEAVEETRQIISDEGVGCTVQQTDVTQAEQVEAMVDRCIETYGRVDILHNNVGIVEVGGPVEASEESWDRVVAVNLKSMFLTCKFVLPHMEEQGGGAIVNISSIAGIRYLGVPYVSYSATKGAVLQLTQSIALQYAEKNIRANSILPGLMNTPMIIEPLKEVYAEGDIEKMLEIRNNQVPMKRMGDAWDVAHAALFLASDEATYITGAQLVVDGGLTCKS